MARYIDVDKFDTYLRMNHFPSKIMYKGKTIYDYLKEYADKKVEDVRENVYGEWITDTELALAGNVCSACGKVANSIFYKTNFCPNCGADMRGGVRC